MELYPRIGRDFDVKTFTNCRFGMMGWAIVGISFCAKQVRTPQHNQNPTFQVSLSWIPLYFHVP